jgi:LysM repeat protein
MRKFYVVLVSLSVMTLSAQAAVKMTKHTIKSGETLYTIAHANHTTIEEVRKANGLKKGDTLKIGKVLTVPKDTYSPNKSKSKKSISKTTKHIIKSGETLYIIAHANHTTIEKVRKANGLKKGDTLKIGRVLTVPKDTYFSNKKIAKKTTKKKSVVKIAKHSIKKGETLFAIARKHHTTIDEVRKTNGLKKGDTLKIGRVIKVPVNTYNVPKVKIAKKTVNKKKKIKVVKHTKKSNKKLVASLAKLETITLEKGEVVKHKKSSSLSFSDIFFSSNDSDGKKSTKITSLAKKM